MPANAPRPTQTPHTPITGPDVRTPTTLIRCSHGYLPGQCPYYLDPGVFLQPCPHFSIKHPPVATISKPRSAGGPLNDQGIPM